MTTNRQGTSFVVFVIGLISFSAYLVQAEEVEVLPLEPMMEVMEIVTTEPELLETESEPIPSENLADLGVSTSDNLPDLIATGTIAVGSDLNIPIVDLMVEETILEESVNTETSVLEVITVLDVTQLPTESQMSKFPEKLFSERLPNIIQDCLGGGFRDFSQPFAHPGECLAYVRSL